MKRIVKIALFLTAMAAIAIATIGAVLADGTGTSPGPNHAEVKGIISAITEATTSTPATVTIQPVGGPAVTVKVVAITVITKAGLGNTTVDELEVGDVAVAIYNKDTLEASKISVSRPVAKHHGYEGTIESIADPGATSTSFVLTPKKGGGTTINVNAETKYKVPGLKDATLANFKVGDRVAVLVVEMNGGWTALHVNLIPGKPVHVQRVGIIATYTAASTSTPGNITLKSKKGDLSTFVVTTDTKIKFKRGATAVTLGSKATVVARRDPATDKYTATEILVFGPKGHEGNNNGSKASKDNGPKGHEDKDDGPKASKDNGPKGHEGNNNESKASKDDGPKGHEGKNNGPQANKDDSPKGHEGKNNGPKTNKDD